MADFALRRQSGENVAETVCLASLGYLWFGPLQSKFADLHRWVYDRPTEWSPFQMGFKVDTLVFLGYMFT